MIIWAAIWSDGICENGITVVLFSTEKLANNFITLQTDVEDWHVQEYTIDSEEAIQ